MILISSTASAAISETRIATNKSYSDYPAIYNNKIVWHDNLNGHDICVYDLSTKKQTQITTNELEKSFPAIYGNRIVWHDNLNGNWDIHV